MFVYRQKSGEFFQVVGFDEHGGEAIAETGMYGTLLGVGYAGRVSTDFGRSGRNNPEMQGVSNFGPLPAGAYTIGTTETHPHLGELSMPLAPEAGNQMFNRGDFWIHGDNATHDASHGCIVQAHVVRAVIAEQVLLGNNHLLVME